MKSTVPTGARPSGPVISGVRKGRRNMIRIDIGICIPFALALIFWSRGVWRRNASDIILSSCILVAALVIYVWLYAFTSLAGAPWIFLAVCALAAIVAAAKRKKTAHRGFSVATILLPILLSVMLFTAEWKWSASSNSLMIILPYRHGGTWVFDDPRAGLQAEPFVSGIPELIDRLLSEARIEDADKGFRLLFSLQPFPGYQTQVVWRRSEFGGNWYYSEKYNMEGWLCPALFKYFKRAPKKIYVKAEKK